VVLAALAAAGACLPDLAELPSEVGPLEAGAASFRGCGDGIIETLDDGGDAGESCDPGSDASLAGCEGCQITCEGALDPLSHHCYFAAGTDSSYGGAATRCKDRRAHLVTISSADEAARVTAVASGSSHWIGLARSALLLGAYQANRPEEPGFPYPPLRVPAAAGPCPGCFGVGADAGVFPLADVDASDPQADTSCVAAQGERWFRVPCTSGPDRVTLCEREPTGARERPCIGAYCFSVPQTSGAKTYLLVGSMTEPDVAAETCRELGGSLVVFATNAEREQVVHEILERYPDEPQQLWIGLVRDAGTWVWEDGVLADAEGGRPRPWGNAEPREPSDAGPAAGQGARAFIRVGVSAYDTQLAQADNGPRTPRGYICERR
jgi:hypothetical protein